MRTIGNKPCAGEVFSVLVLLLFICFCYWLTAESDDEKIHRIFETHDRLVLEGKRNEAGQLFHKALDDEGNGPLDPIWWPLIRTQGNGYDQLTYHLRILKADPEREKTYESIANLIEFAPDAFHTEIKQRYYADLAKVEDVRNDLLEQYGLLMHPAE